MLRTKLTCASGIYQIKSTTNNKIYIGSAVNFKNRKADHICTLKRNKHNQHLQNHFNKYGLDDLVFSILEFCPPKKLIEREQHYMDALNPEFNICKIAGNQLGFKHSEETKKRMSEYHRNRPKLVRIEHSKKMKGKNNPNFGKHPVPWNKGLRGVQIPSEETRKKMSEAQKRRYQ